jgi:hypothetical protein
MTEDQNVDTRFELDDRQRAMLAEMGVRVWLPKTPLSKIAEMPATSLQTTSTTDNFDAQRFNHFDTFNATSAKAGAHASGRHQCFASRHCHHGLACIAIGGVCMYRLWLVPRTSASHFG